MKIRTNKINFSLNVERILSLYDVFYIKYKGQKFDLNILDMDFEPEHKAKAVVYTYGKNAFMLFDKNQITADELHEILNQEYNQPQVDVYHQKSFNEDYQQRTLFRLLMNGLHNNYSKAVMYNNLTGRLYYFNKKWRYKTSDMDRIWCLNISFNEDNTITAVVETYMSSKDNYYHNNDIKLVFDEKTSQLRKQTKVDKQQIVYVKQSLGWNSKVRALDFSDKNRYETSKYGVMYQFKNDMEEGYPRLVVFNWTEYDAEDITMNDREIQAVEGRNYKDRYNCKGLNIINTLGDEGKTLLSQIKGELTSRGINFVVSNEVKSDKFNFVLIKDKDAYADGEDPYKKTKGYHVQHITDRELTKEAMNVILSEAIIKDDINKSQISIADWTSYGFSDDIYFAKRDKNDVHYVIKVKVDGTIERRKFEIPETYEDAVIKSSFLKKSNPDRIDSSIEFLAWSDYEDMYAFKMSNEILLPEMTELGNVVKQINPNKKYSSEELLPLIDSADCNKEYILTIREAIKDKDFVSIKELCSIIKGRGTDGIEMRNHLAEYGIVLRVSKGKDSGNGLVNYAGVKCFKEPINDSICKFYVGKKNGISNYHLEKSVLIRSAIRLNEKPIDMNFIGKVLRLPQVTFVKSGQYSVHPFIYKFLTEFMEVE